MTTPPATRQKAARNLAVCPTSVDISSTRLPRSSSVESSTLVRRHGHGNLRPLVQHRSEALSLLFVSMILMGFIFCSPALIRVHSCVFKFYRIFKLDIIGFVSWLRSRYICSLSATDSSFHGPASCTSVFQQYLQVTRSFYYHYFWSWSHLRKHIVARNVSVCRTPKDTFDG
jgi:hypothetical protein